jgi:hypothetical protein
MSAPEEQQPPPAAAMMAAATPAGGSGQASSLKLPAFWPEAPELWFTQVNCIFATRGMTGSFDKFCHAVAALQHDSLLRLPPQLRVLLTKQDPTDLVALAEHADELWSHQQQDGIIAAVDALVVEDGTVAAVSRGGGSGRRPAGRPRAGPQREQEVEA